MSERPLPDNPGFDAVLGNPPWDVLRADSGEKPFFRSSGIYRHQGGGHINRYQVFVERALMLARRGGRVRFGPAVWIRDRSHRCPVAASPADALECRHDQRRSTIEKRSFRFTAAFDS